MASLPRDLRIILKEDSSPLFHLLMSLSLFSVFLFFSPLVFHDSSVQYLSRP